MKIEVAGAGAGKTSRMASRILDVEIPDGKIVYCVAFTNAAADNIRRKLGEKNADNVKVSTIHSFLYSELVRPYYHLLYGVRYKRISTISLPTMPAYRNVRIKELEGSLLLHQTVIPERAKWVVYKKSKENAQIRAMRAKILAMFAGYCNKIIVDEAQDIDKNIRDVLLALHKAGIDIELCGDPKQDVKGHGCFREIIEAFPDNVTYNSECHRCPQQHLQISNRLACVNEQQVADEETCVGRIIVLFEADTDVADHIEHGDYGLAYISKKNDRFSTHAKHNETSGFDSLRHELDIAIRDKHGSNMTDLEVKRAAYYVARQMIALINAGSEAGAVVSKGISNGFFDYDATRYARMAEALKSDDSPDAGTITIRSIEAVKGLEAEKCLFVLTTDLAPYLLGDKTDDNKTKHLLYVALTRSLDNLTVLVTTEVESRYSRERILAAFGARIS